MTRVLTRSLLTVLGVVVALWVVNRVAAVLLLGVSAVIVATAVNGPVTWLEQRRVPRLWGTLAVFATAALVTVLIAVVVGSRLVSETRSVRADAPAYLEQARERIGDYLGQRGRVNAVLPADVGQRLTRAIHQAIVDQTTRIGQATLGVVSLIVLTAAWVTLVAFLTIEPRSLLRGMLRLTPVDERARVERVWIRFSAMVRAWLWANLLVGGIEAVLAAGVLTWLDIPGALVWAAVSLFTVFIPKIGLWIAMTPPILVALAVDPGDAVWIILFYVVVNSVMSDLVLPRIQGGMLRVHAFYLVLFVLVFGTTFGLVGALIATPVAGFVAAVFEEFVMSRRPLVRDEEAAVERMLAGR